MRNIELLPEETVSEIAERMVALAKDAKETITAKFNGTVLTADEGSTAGDIVHRYFATRSGSPEAKSARREGEKLRKEDRRKYDALVRQLPDLDFTDYEVILDWLCELQNAAESSGTTKGQAEILVAFTKHGYRPGVNAGKAYDGKDRENVARYIIGQALGGLQKGVGILNTIHGSTDDWKKKFDV